MRLISRMESTAFGGWRRNGSLADYWAGNNVNPVKWSKAMSRPKEQVAGWIIEENEKVKGTTGE